ncbi:hypothetical protein [Rhodococcus sp. NPDC127528]|uniref:hypothetical protein n=1 Tax=unclassified Rhodococcus (in: high G+C Gram-positive bacteria) TaxID=192944 RepID=UPI00363E1644
MSATDYRLFDVYEGLAHSIAEVRGYRTDSQTGERLVDVTLARFGGHDVIVPIATLEARLVAA